MNAAQSSQERRAWTGRARLSVPARGAQAHPRMVVCARRRSLSTFGLCVIGGWSISSTREFVRGAAAAHHGRLCDGVLDGIRIKVPRRRTSMTHAQEQRRRSSERCC